MCILYRIGFIVAKQMYEKMEITKCWVERKENIQNKMAKDLGRMGKKNAIKGFVYVVLLNVFNGLEHVLKDFQWNGNRLYCT